jgi:uncharacterized heparinase superfamily protein
MGHLYVAAFADGVTKVGRTNNPSTRFAVLRKEAKNLGHFTMLRHWVSEPHDGTERTEEQLITWATRHGEPLTGGREWFTDVVYEEAITAAQHIIGGMELTLALATNDIRNLVPGTIGYRLREAVLKSFT